MSELVIKNNIINSYNKPGERNLFPLLIAACIYVWLAFDTTDYLLISLRSFIFMICSFIGVFALYLLWYLQKNKDNCLSPLSVGMLTVLSAALFAGAVSSNNIVFYLIIFGLLADIFAAILLFIEKKLTTQRIIMLLFAAGFLLRVAYILYTSVSQRQHDVWYFNDSSNDIGHAGYIEYFYKNMELPDFDPRTKWQYYHPPLHHIISALWLKINVFLGMSYSRAVENIQILTLFYSSACMIISYKIFKAIGLKKLPLILSSAVIAFHPAFIIMSGSVNNDILSITLAFTGILAAIKWYQKPTFGRIAILGVCIGFAMMAKLSAALIAPAVAVLFLIKLIKETDRLGNYILQFALFGVICIPLALWWQVYNYIKFQMPITYVPLLSTSDSGQYIGDRTAIQRLFGFNFKDLSPVFMNWNDQPIKSGYTEYNMLLSLFKTSVFGEFTLFSIPDGELSPATAILNTTGVVFSYGLFFSNILLTITGVIGAVTALFNRKSYISNAMLLFIGMISITVLGSYIKFCFEFPHTCSQNIRYAMPLILATALFSGGLTMKNNHNQCVFQKKGLCVFFKWWTISVVSVFCLMSAAVYILLGYIV